MLRDTPLRPRKRPSQQRATATVEAILEAAARILEEQGLGGYNTNAIAERAGVSIGSLYQYFPNKDALTAALIDRSLREQRLRLAEAAEQSAGLGLAEALVLFVRAAARHQMARPTLERTLDFAEGRLTVEPLVAEARLGIWTEARALLERHAHLLVDDNLDQTTADMLTIARAMIDDTAARGETDAEALERRVVRALLGYLTQGDLGKSTTLPRRIV
ncbi:MAG: TetR/AcrR family transcriptional regulator [Erythrobacter sp.]